MTESFVWEIIEEYKPKLGITCPIDLKIRKMTSWGTCALRAPSTAHWYTRERLAKEPFDRPYIDLTLNHDLVLGKYGMDKLKETIVHELIHGTGNHTHNKHFYETALSLGIELEHGSYQKFAKCHR